MFSGNWSAANKTVNFQVFDAGKLLSNRWTLIGLPIQAGDTYKRLEEPGLILQDKLTAHFHNGTLYFASYHNTKRFLDLADYYREATDTDLDDFAATDLFAFEDQEGFKEQADSIIRKKIALLQKNEVLKDLAVADIQTVANNFNAELPEEHHITIMVNDDGKLVIPEDKKQLKELIRFLDEDYVTAPPDEKKMSHQFQEIPVSHLWKGHITKCCTRINYSLRSQFTGEHGVKCSGEFRGTSRYKARIRRSGIFGSRPVFDS